MHILPFNWDGASLKMGKKKVYNRIKAVLAEQGRTNIWLAETLNKNKTTVSKWCTNDVQPPMDTLFAIANVLEVEVKDLLVSNGNGSTNQK